MRVTRHLPSNQIHFNYSLHQQTLEQVQSAKYLGISITDDFEWGQHVAEISSKATKTLGFLRRNLALAPRHTKEVAYQTLVRPQLEYAAPIWHPYNETETKKRWRKCRRQQPGGSAGDGIMPVASTCLMNLSGHPWRTAGYVRGSPNGKICKSTNGTVGTIFTNGNQKTLNVFCCYWYQWYHW